jgi:hypothetical protein
MNRRDFLVGAGAAALAACSAGPTREQLNASPVVTVDTRQRGARIAAGHLGLSFESAELGAAELFSARNSELIGLMRTLTPQGTLRLGGNSSDFGLWNGRLAAPFRHAYGPAEVDRFAGFLRACGWNAVWGLNLGHGDPERAADEAAYVARALGDRLVALQIGNEPDLYARNGLRPPDYGASGYIDEWQRYAGAIRARAGDVPLAGPDLAAHPDWMESFARACAGQVRFLSQHYYAVGPAHDPRIDIGALFESERRGYPRLRQASAAARTAGKPYRLTETNSCFEGGKAGVSDTMAAALWAAGQLFEMARDGWSGMYFHGGPQAVYAPLAYDRATRRWRARPLYYGLLLYAQAAPGELLATTVKPDFDQYGAYQEFPQGPRLRAYALAGEDGRLRVALINQDGGRSLDLRIEADRGFARGTLLRLAAPTIYSTDGVTLGGGAAEGGWQPQFETVAVSGQAAYVTITAGGAVLVDLE